MMVFCIGMQAVWFFDDELCHERQMVRSDQGKSFSVK